MAGKREKIGTEDGQGVRGVITRFLVKKQKIVI
jgi:hypothetical protein